MLDNIKNYRLLLGSKSPRRRDLLSELRIPFTTVTVGAGDESFPSDMPPLEVPEFLSNKKADAFLSILKDNEILITADTLVICENEIMGKPASRNDALEMLMFLSGKTHKVATGVTITSTEKRVSFTSVTEVKFAEITPQEARYYVDNFSPLDKAGSYGIQEWIGCVAVEHISGSFYNVMGLPVHQLYRQLSMF